MLLLVDAAYAAATDPRRWPGFLSALARAFDSDQALMLHGERHSAASQEVVTSGLDLEVIARWNECKEHVDVWLQHVFELPVNRAYLSTDLVRPSALYRSGFHSDILRPLDIEYSLGGVMENDWRRTGLFAIYRSSQRGSYTEEDKQLYSLLVPHVGRALAVSRRLHEAEIAKQAGWATLDHLSFGVFLLDRRGNVLFHNRHAQTLLEVPDGLTLGQNRLHAVAAADGGELSRLIADACGLGSGDLAKAGGAMTVRRPSLRRPYVLLVCPLRLEPWSLADSTPSAVVFLTDPESTVELPSDVLARRYGLTPAESRTASLVMQGRSAIEIAEELGVSPDTTRSHLKHLFSKTGTSRQSQLVHLLLASTSSVQLDRSGI